MILGIDCGAHGALALLTDGGSLLSVIDMPSVEVKVGGSKRTRVAGQALALWVVAQKPEHAYVENVWAGQAKGSLGNFGLGLASGIVDGVLAALGVPVTYVTPAAWKKAHQVNADKGSSRRRAMQLWPVQATEFQRVKDDGRAEAALIGMYGLRMAQRGTQAA